MNFKNTFFLAATGLLISAGATFAQVKKKPTPSPKSKPIAPATQIRPQAQLLPVDPFLVKGTLPNGLTYYIRPTASVPKRAELYLLNKVGSVLETDAQRGFAHLISHLAIQSTRDNEYLKKHKIQLKADTDSRVGYDETIYHLSAITDTLQALDQSIGLLAKWAGKLNFNAADLSVARPKVVEEIRSSAASVKDRLDKAALPVMLNNSRYSQRVPVGEEATVNAADIAALKGFYADWYRPGLQAIVVVGDVDVKQVETLIKNSFSDLKNPAVPKPVQQYNILPAAGTTVKFITDKALPYVVTQIVIKHPEVAIKTADNYMQSIQIELFNQMLSARIDEVKQQSNSPFLFAQAAYDGFASRQDALSALVISNPDGTEAAIKALAREIERVRRFGFASTELERAKQNALQQVIYEYEQRDRITPGSLAAEFQRNFLLDNAAPGISYKYNFFINNIGKIDLAAMNALAANLITDQNRVILIEGPESEKDKLPKEPIVRTWFATAGANLTAYEDDASVPLMDKIPTPGKVVSSKTDSVIQATYLTLSNGVKVILKPTRFQDGQILINGYSFGGTSVASDQDFPSASLAASAIVASGVAGFTQTQLEKMLRGKNLRMTPYISDITQGFSGNAAPADFETALQLLHLYITQPRKDPAVWQNIIAQTKAFLVTRGTDELSIFQDTATAISSNYHPRGMNLTTTQLNAASLDKGYQFYKDRFGNAGNFTFLFTGSFAVDAITPYIETYLGSLPTGKAETFKNLGIHPPAGRISKTIVKGKGDRSVAEWIFSGLYDYNEANNIQLDALETLLYLKIAQRLNDTTGTVSSSVRVNYGKLPEGRYKVTVDLECPVDQVEKMTAVVNEEIEKMKQTGALPKEINTFVLQEARAMQSQLKQNPYWSGALSVAAQNGDDPDRILNRVQILDQITIQSTKEAAMRYLNTNNVIYLVLKPEKK